VFEADGKAVDPREAARPIHPFAPHSVVPLGLLTVITEDEGVLETVFVDVQEGMTVESLNSLFSSLARVRRFVCQGRVLDRKAQILDANPTLLPVFVRTAAAGTTETCVFFRLGHRTITVPAPKQLRLSDAMPNLTAGAKRGSRDEVEVRDADGKRRRAADLLNLSVEYAISVVKRTGHTWHRRLIEAKRTVSAAAIAPHTAVRQQAVG
jgi:hypothetical protein